MRLFLAIELTEPIRSRIDALMQQLKTIGLDVKFTDPRNLHFTMKFLGEVDEDHVNE